MARKGEVLFSTQGADVLATGVAKYDNFFMRHKKSISFAGVNYIKANPFNKLAGMKAVNEKTIDLSKYISEKNGKDVLKIWNKSGNNISIAPSKNNTDERLEVSGLKKDGTYTSAIGIERGNYGQPDRKFNVLLDSSSPIEQTIKSGATRGAGGTSTGY